MRVWSLGEVESRFVEIVWAHQPVSTRELIAVCEKELNWKRTTTYTVLKKMCDRGLFALENGVVSQKITREEFFAQQSQRFVEEAFGGSLPAFVLAFAEGKSLTPEERALLESLLSRKEVEPRE
ncbi:MAG: BlaI/MecI/CopY family transcriptional regulator [Clostridia bacterium]|nr:BlaI/MecI/CopY family transcriptional regulator [Clostridia bacterium]